MEDEHARTNAQAKPKSQSHLLLEITAISGEYPAENIPRLIPSASYAKKVVTALINGKMIKPVYKNGVRGYRLEKKAKSLLLSENRARYKDYMEGATDTNKMRSDKPRRLRLHSAAEVYTLMLGAKIRIFKDTKPRIFLLDEPADSSQTAFSQPIGKITAACFYSSREQKGEDDNAIRGASAAGTLLTPTHVYAIYNTSDAETRWRDSVEMRYRADIRDYVCRKILLGQYNGADVGGIMIGKDLEILRKYLTSETKAVAVKFFSETYQPFYFITNDTHGEAQLRLLCDNARMNELKSAMQKGLLSADSKYPIEHDALTEDGNPVLFCCLLNIPRLVQFKTGLQLHGKAGKVIAFDFQKEMLERYLGEPVEFKGINFDRLMGILYPQSYRALRDAVPKRSEDT